MSEVRRRVEEYFHERTGQPVSIDEISGDLRLSPDDVYRVVLVLVDEGLVKVVPASIEKRELELVAG